MHSGWCAAPPTYPRRPATHLGARFATGRSESGRQDVNEIDAVPRWYHQTAFRSSLEADWARTLDGLGVEWTYEPVKITLPSGNVYIPDFWLPGIGTFIEVKGDGVPRRHKPRELSHTLADLDSPEWGSIGGLLVILGLPSVWRLGGYGRHESRANWASAFGGNVLLGHCRRCGAWSWVALRLSLACRKCRVPFGAGDHLNGPGEVPFLHADRTSWTLAN